MPPTRWRKSLPVRSARARTRPSRSACRKKQQSGNKRETWPSAIVSIRSHSSGRALLRAFSGAVRQTLTKSRLSSGTRAAGMGTAIRHAHTAHARDADALIGNSPAFAAARHTATHVATRHSTVLLLGETGTGKELMARLIHARSARAGKPFIPVDCSSL